LFAQLAGPNFEVGGSLVIDVGRQEQFEWIVSDRAAVWKFDDGQAVIKDFECSFLPFSSQDMPEDEHRLSLALRAEVSQGVLCVRGAGKLAGRAGSEDWRWHNGRLQE